LVYNSQLDVDTDCYTVVTTRNALLLVLQSTWLL
uniref:Neur_chan_LBD domain-containing protein n=1 Tax=Mesocestoides corti TaxID=53468 RepID=A0A0R3U2A9_MESCO